MKNITISSKAGYFVTCIAGLVLVLSACSSEDTADLTINISGTITTSTQGDEVGITVTGIYSDGNLLNPSTITGAGGVYSLPVLKNTPVSVQVSKNGYTTLNSVTVALSANEAGVDFELPTTGEANASIGLFNPALNLGSGAWLAVNVVDGTGTEVDLATISTTPKTDLVDEAATDCAGMDSGNVITIYDPCNPERDGPMYWAYFSADQDVTVSVTNVAESQTAPVRNGEVTFLEFVQ